MAKVGAPTKYSKELGDRICHEIATHAIGLKHICNMHADFPSTDTIYQWIGRHKEFADNYARAKECQLELMAEEILDIADDGANDLMTLVKGDVAYTQENREVTNRSRLRVDTRKWLLAKLNPKKYGDKIDMTSDGEKLGTPLSDDKFEQLLAAARQGKEHDAKTDSGE